jgi:hypothetical protein
VKYKYAAAIDINVADAFRRLGWPFSPKRSNRDQPSAIALEVGASFAPLWAAARVGLAISRDYITPESTPQSSARHGSVALGIDESHCARGSAGAPSVTWHVADQHQRRIFALDFAGVNAALDHDDGTVRFGRRRRCEGSFLRHHDGDHGAPLGRRADIQHLDEPRGALEASG